MKLTEIKKALMTDRVRLSQHAKKQMEKRGYSRGDVITGIMSGREVEHQFRKGRVQLLIEGRDRHDQPIAISIGHGKQRYYTVVTVMPPLLNKFTRVI